MSFVVSVPSVSLDRGFYGSPVTPPQDPPPHLWLEGECGLRGLRKGRSWKLVLLRTLVDVDTLLCCGDPGRRLYSLYPRLQRRA